MRTRPWWCAGARNGPACGVAAGALARESPYKVQAARVTCRGREPARSPVPQAGTLARPSNRYNRPGRGHTFGSAFGTGGRRGFAAA
jgi:hypothetical protein